MNIVHLESTALRNSVAIRPAGCLGTMGWHNGKAWQAIYVTPRQFMNRSLVFRRWNKANYGTMAVSLDAPVIAGVES